MPRPRSESFYLNLAPNVSAVLSIQTKASLSATRSPPTTPPPTPPPAVPTSPTRPFPFPRTPLSHIVAPPEDADDERDVPRNQAPTLPRKRSNPDLKFAHSQIRPAQHRWSPKAPSPLRRDASKPFCPSSLFTTQTALLPFYPIASATPRPIPPRSPGLSTGGRTLEGDAPELKLPCRRRTPLCTSTLRKAFFAGDSGSCARRFGVRTAWNISEDVRRSLATDHLHSIFDFSSSEENDDEDEEFASPCYSPNIEHAVKEAICGVQVYPETRAASSHKRSPSEQSDEDTSSGSDGGEEYSPTHFDESSSDEEDGLHPENEETWELISI